jgi:hypothetical protein
MLFKDIFFNFVLYVVSGGQEIVWVIIANNVESVVIYFKLIFSHLVGGAVYIWHIIGDVGKILETYNFKIRDRIATFGVMFGF